MAALGCVATVLAALGCVAILLAALGCVAKLTGFSTSVATERELAEARAPLPMVLTSVTVRSLAEVTVKRTLRGTLVAKLPVSMNT